MHCLREYESKVNHLSLVSFLFSAAIRHEIQDIEDGKMDKKINPLKVGGLSRLYWNGLSIFLYYKTLYADTSQHLHRKAWAKFARAHIHRRQSWRMKAILMSNDSLG